MTKPITGVAGLLLWEEGRLGLADPIERFLPQLGNRRVAVLNERVLAGQGPIETVPAERSITIQDLMRHTSGLTYGGRGTTAVHALSIPRRFWNGSRPRRCCINPGPSGTTGCPSTSLA
jgi:CubicO group peptidase (beta-lactamase class C family)